MSKTRTTTNSSADALDPEFVLRETAENLRKMLAKIASARCRGPEERSARVKEVARLSTSLNQVCGELRQFAKGRVRALAEYPLDEIVAYLRSLPKQRRDEAFTIAFGADESEPLL